MYECIYHFILSDVDLWVGLSGHFISELQNSLLYQKYMSVLKLS